MESHPKLFLSLMQTSIRKCPGVFFGKNIWFNFSSDWKVISLKIIFEPGAYNLLFFLIIILKIKTKSWIILESEERKKISIFLNCEIFNSLTSLFWDYCGWQMNLFSIICDLRAVWDNEFFIKLWIKSQPESNSLLSEERKMIPFLRELHNQSL